MKRRLRSIYLNRGKQLIGMGEPDESKVIQDVRRKQAHREAVQAENADKVEDASRKTFNERWQEMKDSTLLAELLIAYGIHKSLIDPIGTRNVEGWRFGPIGPFSRRPRR